MLKKYFSNLRNYHSTFLGGYSGFVHIGLISIILVIAVVFALFFFLQSATEDRIKNELFQKQLQRQTESAQSTSQHIGSDLDSLLVRLQSIASSPNLQTQNLVDSSKIAPIIEQMKNQISHEQGQYLDNVFIADKNGIIRFSNDHGSAEKEKISIVGRNISSLDYVKKTKTNLLPIFSNASTFLDNKFSIIMTYPIINNTIGQTNNNNNKNDNNNNNQKEPINRYLGLVGISIPTSEFFNSYGNTQNLDTQFLRAYDKNGTILVNPMKQMIGKNYFGNYIQNTIHHNTILNNLMNALIISGQPGTKVFDVGLGERLIITQPISVRNTHQYFMALVTPTTSIYSDIDNILSLQKAETLILFIGLSIAIIILIIIYIKWNTILRKEVEKKTDELDISNKQLMMHDKMQKEFINMAAHELRTPAQVILGYSELASESVMMQYDKGGFIDIISKNAFRLVELVKEILDVSRIESKTLTLQRERFDLEYVVNSVVENMKNRITNHKNTKLVIDGVLQSAGSSQASIITVYADKMKISQVVSNLLSNAFKFTSEGDTITITISRRFKTMNLNRKHDENNSSNNNDNNNDDINDKYTTHKNKTNRDIEVVVVTIRDTGRGISPNIFPRLFTKFATNSDVGTGLGLFISKSIIEAHGGMIWGENNADGKGATFGFSLSANS
jgi:signal transduction histidine kinase